MTIKLIYQLRTIFFEKLMMNNLLNIEPAIRIFIKTSQNQVFELNLYLTIAYAFLKIKLDNISKILLPMYPKRIPANHKLKQNNTQSPHINLIIIIVANNQFWTQIQWSATKSVSHFGALAD